MQAARNEICRSAEASIRASSGGLTEPTAKPSCQHKNKTVASSKLATNDSKDLLNLVIRGPGRSQGENFPASC